MVYEIKVNLHIKCQIFFNWHEVSLQSGLHEKWDEKRGGTSANDDKVLPFLASA